MSKISNEIKETVKDAKAWIEDHPKIALGIFATSGILTFMICEKRSRAKELKSFPEFKKAVETTGDSLFRKIDEDIFTSLASDIEDAVCNEGLDKAVLDRIYDIGNGYHKYVKVNIKTIYDKK